MNVLDDIQAEVIRLADEMTPELLPALLEQMTKREGIIHCRRHGDLLRYYVSTQIILTRVKRKYWDGHDNVTEGQLKIVTEQRDERRHYYRTTPCTCWVPKR